ncbi:MAG TPA: TlpA disulfide reductase family protein [Vicinamibacterales bacterium]|nr:TlpA disulfide reductase family protein [Vicinamibacterales bacterium]
MKITRNRWMVLSAVLLIVVLLVALRKEAYEVYVLEHFDKEAPALELQTLDGEIITPDTFRNKVVVLDFWATWCGPCRRTLPLLEEVYNEYRQNPDVVILAVNTSWNNSIEDARRFVAQYDYTVPFAYDRDSRVADALVRPRGIPTFCILDRSGKLRLRHVGYLKWFEDYRTTLKRQLERLLKE